MKSSLRCSWSWIPFTDSDRRSGCDQVWLPSWIWPEDTKGRSLSTCDVHAGWLPLRKNVIRLPVDSAICAYAATTSGEVPSSIVQAMYGPGTGISVIAFPTGIPPLVVGNGGTDTCGSLTGGALTEGLDDPGRPVVGAGVSETGESLEMLKGTCAHAVSTVPVTAPVATAKNPR